MDIIILAILASVGGTTAVVIGATMITLARNPEKIEIWAGILNKVLSGFGGLFRSAHKRYVKHDLQGRINRFTKGVSKVAPYLADTRIVIEWTDTNQDKKAFLDNDKVVIRLRRDDPDDLNFVHGAYWSVATRLIPKVKRYVSPSQREALDLYVTAQIIEKEKYQVIEHFLEHYLHPRMVESNKAIPQLYRKFDNINRYGTFYPVLLQELYFLSMKIYGGPQSDNIIVEVTRLVDFLERVATRNIGEEMGLNFTGEYCRFAIVIIGKAYKISHEGVSVYTRYVRQQVLPQKVETIYIIGKEDYRGFIDEVCSYLGVSCEQYASYQYTGELSSGDTKRKEKQYLVVLRTSEAPVYQPQ